VASSVRSVVNKGRTGNYGLKGAPMPRGAAYHLAEKHLRQYSGPLDGESFHKVAERCILRPPKTTANKLPTNAEHKNTTSIVAKETLPNARICSKSKRTP